MPVPNLIAIDGPAASGKSTLGELLAKELGYLYFDTGVMYRAVTWAALQQNIPIEDEAAVTALAERIQIDVRPPSKNDGRAYDVWVNDRDVTWDIRTAEVEANVSLVSSYRGVRRALTLQQRRIGARGRVVMVGRDIGTVVFPEAEVKIYLVASVEERARRRFEELRSRGEAADYKEILEAMRKRDDFDASRQIAPMRPADDAYMIDTDGLSIEEVLKQVMCLLT
jgi:cytidylate kinase